MRVVIPNDSASPCCGLPSPSSRVNPLGLGNGSSSALSHKPLPNSVPSDDAGQETLSQSGERNLREIKRGWRFKPFSAPKDKQKLNNAVVADVRIEMGEESAGLLGDFIMAGALEFVPGRKRSCRMLGTPKTDIPFRATLTNKFFSIKSTRMSLDDVVAVTWTSGSRQFTLHSYPKSPPRCFSSVPILCNNERKRRDLIFKAPSVKEVKQWVSAFADLGCFIRFLSETISPLEREKTVTSLTPSGLILDEENTAEAGQKSTLNGSGSSGLKLLPNPVAVVVINPNSGKRKAEKIFRTKVKPVLELAGFKLTVLETCKAKHAEEIAQSLDLSKCINGIICIGGDGIVNEVLNGLHRRSDLAEAIKIPLGVVPAGSDNSLVWSVLGIRDPVSAALAIVKGEHFPVDSLQVWREGIVAPGDNAYLGHTIAYFGFMSDVLELSSRYQRRFGPLRYLVAGLRRMIFLPKFNMDVEFLPASEGTMRPPTPHVNSNPPPSNSNLATDTFCSELISSISITADGLCLPVFSESEDLQKTASETHPNSKSNSSRGLIPDLDLAVPFGRSTVAGSIFMRSRDLMGNDALAKGKRSPPSDTRKPTEGTPEEDIVISTSGLIMASPHTSPSARHRARKFRGDHRARAGWVQLEPEDCDYEADIPRISSTKSEADISDKDRHLNLGSPFLEGRFKRGSHDNLRGLGPEAAIADRKTLDHDENIPERGSEGEEEGWVTKKGPFLGVMVCNHSCKSVQCFDSQALAPRANAEDGFVDLLLVRPVGRIQLIRFLFLMQFGMHVDLPFVEYIKARAVKINMGVNQHKGCGVDGELLPLEKSAFVSIKHFKYRIIGRSRTSST